jgi:hypothetical protein
MAVYKQTCATVKEALEKQKKGESHLPQEMNLVPNLIHLFSF